MVNNPRFLWAPLNGSPGVRLRKNLGVNLQESNTKEGQHAGDENAARKFAEELGYLPLALERAAAFIIELRWSFANIRSDCANCWTAIG